jgi:hypothetical protein
MSPAEALRKYRMRVFPISCRLRVCHGALFEVRTGSCAPRSGPGGWLSRAAVTRTDAARSAAMRRRTGLPPSTGETDDENAYDTRRPIAIGMDPPGSRARTAPDRLTRYAQHAVFSQVNARELRSTDETRPVPDASRHLMCVVIVCTMASRCIRRYVHDME